MLVQKYLNLKKTKQEYVLSQKEYSKKEQTYLRRKKTAELMKDVCQKRDKGRWLQLASSLASYKKQAEEQSQFSLSCLLCSLLFSSEDIVLFCALCLGLVSSHRLGIDRAHFPDCSVQVSSLRKTFVLSCCGILFLLTDYVCIDHTRSQSFLNLLRVFSVTCLEFKIFPFCCFRKTYVHVEKYDQYQYS
jgi:hypothetical protein